MVCIAVRFDGAVGQQGRYDAAQHPNKSTGTDPSACENPAPMRHPRNAFGSIPMAMAPTEKLEEHAAPQAGGAPFVKTPPRARPARVSSSAAKVAATRSSPKIEDRTLAIERELVRVQKRADARGKEADSLRQRVQELEPEVRRLSNELEKRRQRESSRSRSPLGRRKHPSPTSMAPGEGDVALRGRLIAADNRAKILQLRCDQLERSSEAGPAKSQEHAAAETEGPSSSTRKETNADDERHHTRAKDSEAKQIKRQLEVAERRVQNSLYINEAHESLATKATERENEANARAAELGRRLDRALEKLQSIERKDMILNLKASCMRDEEGIHLAQRELRAHQMDPELYLPVNTAKRRQLARSEKSLQRLRLRHESQAAALRQAQATEQFHSDLRRAAGLGDMLETAKCLKWGISVNVPDQHGLSAFLYACGQGNPELIRMLIDAGGDVLDGDRTITGLIIAARKVRDIVLLAGCRSSVSKELYRRTAARFAPPSWHVHQTQLLVSRRNSPEVTGRHHDANMSTPLEDTKFYKL